MSDLATFFSIVMLMWGPLIHFAEWFYQIDCDANSKSIITKFLFGTASRWILTTIGVTTLLFLK